MDVGIRSIRKGMYYLWEEELRLTIKTCSLWRENLEGRIRRVRAMLLISQGLSSYIFTPIGVCYRGRLI